MIDKIDKIMENLDKSYPQVSLKKGKNSKLTFFLADNVMKELEKLKAHVQIPKELKRRKTAVNSN